MTVFCSSMIFLLSRYVCQVLSERFIINILLFIVVLVVVVVVVVVVAAFAVVVVVIS